MGKYKYFLKNIGLLTMSNFATKLVSLFLIPLYTNILSTTDYGTYDLFNTTIAVLIPILTLDIQESVMRFSLDKKFNKKSILSIALRYFLYSNLFVIIGLIINYIFRFSTIIKEYAVFFFLMYFTQALLGLVLAYIRGIESITDLSLSSLIGTILIIVCNILFLIYLKWGLIGYFLANIIGCWIQCLYLMIRANVFRDFEFLCSLKREIQEMTTYSKPLIFNHIAWWINNASDRYIIVFFCGIAENGIYSVASKIPSILNIFQTIFSQAWTISAVKDFDSEDKENFFSKTYAIYNSFMVILCSVIILLDKFLAKILYANDFFTAWKYAPWLTIAIVFGSLSGYIGGIFSAVKNSKIFAQSTIIGAFTNVVLNIILIPYIRSLGAAIATTVCYIVTWIFRYIHSKKFIKLKIRLIRDVTTYVILIAQSVILFIMEDSFFSYSVEILLLVIILFFYHQEINLLLRKTDEIIRGKL